VLCILLKSSLPLRTKARKKKLGNMILKQYENKYLQEVLHLHKTAMENVGAYKGDGPWDDDLRDIKKNYVDSNGEFLIVFDNDKLVGMGAFRKNQFTCC
jgi:hypothetical protein